LFVMQDGEYLSPKDKGHDVEFDSQGRSYVVVREPKMYRLVKNKEFGPHLLKLSTKSNECEVYAFTFVSCTV